MQAVTAAGEAGPDWKLTYLVVKPSGIGTRPEVRQQRDGATERVSSKDNALHLRVVLCLEHLRTVMGWVGRARQCRRRKSLLELAQVRLTGITSLISEPAS